MDKSELQAPPNPRKAPITRCTKQLLKEGIKNGQSQMFDLFLFNAHLNKVTLSTDQLNLWGTNLNIKVLLIDHRLQ